MLHSHLKRTWLLDMSLLLFLLILFYTFKLGSYPLFTPDEGRYSEVAREMVATGDYITPRVNGVAFLDKPIFFYWLQALAIHLFGLKEWALRFFPILIGIFGILMTYASGRYLFDRRTGLVSAIILATSPLFFGGAHYANLDLEVAVFISAALLFFLCAIQPHNRFRRPLLLAAYGFSAVAVLTKGLIGIAFPIIIVGAWMFVLRRWDLFKKIQLNKGLLLFLLLVLPWYLLVQKANPNFFHYFFVTQQVSRFLSDGEFNNKTPFWFYVPIIIVGFFPWTIFLIQSVNKHLVSIYTQRAKHQKELFLLLWAITLLIFFSIPHSKMVSYILPIFPPLALLVGNYLSETWEQQTGVQYQGALHFFIITLLMAVFLMALPYYHWIDLSPQFQPFLTTLTLIVLGSALFSLFFARKTSTLPLFLICMVCSTLFLITLMVGAVHLNQNTAKPLIANLKSMLKPGDEVATYFKYYHDVPLYLERSVAIVNNWDSPDIIYNDNWARELWVGQHLQNDDLASQMNEKLMDEKTFWDHWNSDKRVFVFLNANYFKQFKLHVKSYYPLGRYNNIILLSNKPALLN